MNLPAWLDRDRLRALVPRAAALLVVLIGLGVLWAGISRTSLGGASVPVGQLTSVGDPVVVAAPGMTDLGTRMEIRAGSGGARNVFIGVGRAEDVEAYLGRVARTELTALQDDGTFVTTRSPGEASLPDPAGVDVWVAQAHGKGTARLEWPSTPGRWRFVVAGDGRPGTPAASVTWSGTSGGSSAPALLAIGVLLTGAGAAGFLAIRAGRLFAADDDGVPSEQVRAARRERTERVAGRALPPVPDDGTAPDAEADADAGGPSTAPVVRPLPPATPAAGTTLPATGSPGTGSLATGSPATGSLGTGSLGTGSLDTTPSSSRTPGPGSRRERRAAETGGLRMPRLGRSAGSPTRATPPERGETGHQPDAVGEETGTETGRTRADEDVDAPRVRPFRRGDVEEDE